MNHLDKRAVGAIAAIAGSVALSLSAPAVAHHSTAMFDFSKTVEVKGTIKEFQWTNPHTWTKVDVEGGGSAVVEYGLEGMSPNYLSRNGWSKRTLKTGDKVLLQVHPLKDGRPGGFMVSVKLADGTLLYNLPHREDPAAAAAAAQGR
jgi:Family of unknown function (DUF6152)